MTAHGLPGPEVLEAFEIVGPLETLRENDSGSVVRSGDTVLKWIGPYSMEHQDSLSVAPLAIETIDGVDEEEKQFRLAKPKKTIDGRWLTENGWSAWSYVEGRPAGVADTAAVIGAANRFHVAIRHVPKHDALDKNTSPWGLAHRYCLESLPRNIHPDISPLVAALSELVSPIEDAADQLIHGDLNPGNVLVADGMPPALIDFTPWWGPPEFAVAMFANFLGPRQGSAYCLEAFADISHFPQYLIRAAIRMLFIVAIPDGAHDWEEERTAAEIVLDWVGKS
jgi:hypothetical protein